MPAPLPIILWRAWLLLLLLATSPGWAQQPAAPGTRSLPPTPGLGPDPVLSPQATPAEKAAYTRQLAERTRQRWNYLLTDSLMRTKVFNTAPNALLVEMVRGLPPARPWMLIGVKDAMRSTWPNTAVGSVVSQNKSGVSVGVGRAGRLFHSGGLASQPATSLFTAFPHCLMRFFLSAFLALLAAGSARAQAPAPAWLADLPAALAQANATQRPVLAVFSGSDWCKPCMMLKLEVFDQPEFLRFAEGKLVLARFDFPRNKKNRLPEAQTKRNEQAAAQLNPSGEFPLVVVLSPAGKVLARSNYRPGGSAAFVQYLQPYLLTRP